MAMKMSLTMTSPVLMVLLLLGLSTMLRETQAACGSTAGLASCLSATTADTMPSAACCQGLKTYVATSGQACLCQATTDPQFTRLGAKPQFAIKLPQKCNLAYKAGTVCNGTISF